MIERAVSAALAELSRQSTLGGMAAPSIEAGSPPDVSIDGPIDIEALTRAIITAMREPSEAMQRAWQGPEPWDGEALEIWQAMIDAALSTNG